MTTPTVAPEDTDFGQTFNPSKYDWEAHLKRALEDLKVKRLLVDRDWAYYDGRHPKVWLTDAIKEKLDDQLVSNMAENWCDTAVDAPIKRLSVDGFAVQLEGGKQGDQNTTEAAQAQDVWDDNRLSVVQKEFYTNARCTGESFLMAWKDATKEHGISAAVQDARNIWWPKDAHWTDPDRVIQVWADEDDGVWRATCYYRYVVVRLVGPKLQDGGDSAHPQARYFKVDSKDPGGPHGFEQVPVFRFARSKERRGLIDKIRTIQDKINKLAANLLVSAEFAAWRKTIIMTEQTIDDGDLSFRPNRILTLDPGGGDGGAAPTSVWEGSATELENYSREQDKLIDKLFTKACLPGHLKIRDGHEVPSGVAYEADEGPFTEDILDMQKVWGEVWREFYRVTLGIDVRPQWRNPHIKSDKDEGETVKIFKDAGVPLEIGLKKYAGWTRQEIEELEEMPLSPAEQMQMAITQMAVNGGAGDPNVGQAPGEQPPGTPKPSAPKPVNGAGR